MTSNESGALVEGAARTVAQGPPLNPPPIPPDMEDGVDESGRSKTSETELVASGHPQAIGKFLSSTNDNRRMWAAGVSFFGALFVLGWILKWVSNGHALKIEEMANLAATHRMPELLAYYLVGKGVILSAFVGAALALLRIADRLSRPLFLSDQSGAPPDEVQGTPDTILAALEQIVTLFRRKKD